ncbi:MAG: rhodanese-like domain-containing protein [Alphaproteobacteria bacterium]
MIKSTSPAELHQWLQSDQAVLIDVRQPEEYAAGHIKGATLQPLAQVSAKTLPPFQGKKLVMQCHLGGRSRTACGKLTQEIANLDVYNLEGGIAAWANEGYEVEK